VEGWLSAAEIGPIDLFSRDSMGDHFGALVSIGLDCTGWPIASFSYLLGGEA